MRKLFLSSVLAAALAVPAVAAAGELKLTMNDGLVTLIAKDVPLSMVMAEWSKVGKTTVVNGDKIMTLVTLHLENVPERKALDIVLRAAAGYMVAERAVPVAGGSAFDRVMILPTSQAPANNPSLNRTPPPFAPPRQPNMPMPVPVDDDGDAIVQPVMPPGVQQQPVLPGQGNQNVPQGPLTSPRPGQLPQPAGPQQPVPFGAPRPAGGGPGGLPGGPGGGGGGGQ